MTTKAAGVPGPPTPLEVDAVNAPGAVSLGTLVYVTGGVVGADAQVAPIDITNLAQMPAIGIVNLVTDPAHCTVLLWGIYTEAGAFAPNERYWAGPAATVVPTASIPSVPGQIQQAVGQAIDGNRLMFKPSLEMYLV